MIASTRQPRILYLVHRFPYPPDKGDRIRTFHIVKFLAQRCRLSVGTLADEPVPGEHLETLQGHCAQLHVAALPSPARWLRAGLSLARGRTISEGAFASRELKRAVSDWARSEPFDAVLVSSSSMVPYLEMPELRPSPAVVDLIDVDSEKWLQYARGSRGPKRILYGLEGRRLRGLERQLPAQVRAVTLVSASEAELYRRVCSSANGCGGSAAGPQVQAIGNGVDLEYFRPGQGATEQSVVFVGAMDYRPNVEAVVWFGREVWPKIRGSQPGARFEIVGRNPAEPVRRLAGLAGVTVTGAVRDVRPYLARAALAVAPLQIARGIQNKVLEAMALGRAVVASPEALEGLSVRPGEHVLSATRPDEWIAAVRELLEQPQRREQLGRAARQYVEQHHDWDVRLTGFEELLGIGIGRPALRPACESAVA